MNYQRILSQVRYKMFDYTPKQQIKASRIIKLCKAKKPINQKHYVLSEQNLLFRTA